MKNYQVCVVAPLVCFKKNIFEFTFFNLGFPKVGELVAGFSYCTR
jgi:hypothetical protein